MKRYVWLILDIDNSSDSDKVYDIINKNREELGKVYYYSRWRKYVFEPIADTFYDSKCLLEISDLIKELKKWKQR